MIEIDGQADFDVAPETLFDFLADATGEKDGVGARFAGDYKKVGRMELAITEYVRPRRLAFAVTARRFRFELAAAPGGSHMAAYWRWRPDAARERS